MTSNPAFTERNIQKAYAYLLYSRQEQKSLVTYHTLQSLYVCVWLVNTLTSTAPIGSPIICMWSPADVCEQWERNLSFSSADVRGAGTRDEPLRTSAPPPPASFSKFSHQTLYSNIEGTRRHKSVPTILTETVGWVIFGTGGVKNILQTCANSISVSQEKENER